MFYFYNSIIYTAVVESLSTTLTRCSVTEITSLLQDSTNRMRNLHQMLPCVAVILESIPNLNFVYLNLIMFFLNTNRIDVHHRSIY